MVQNTAREASSGQHPNPPRPQNNMASLPEHIHAALTNLLRGLQLPDNVERTAAEEQLSQEWFAQRPDVLLMGLSEQIDFAPDSSVSKSLPGLR